MDGFVPEPSNAATIWLNPKTSAPLWLNAPEYWEVMQSVVAVDPEFKAGYENGIALDLFIDFIFWFYFILFNLI